MLLILYSMCIAVSALTAQGSSINSTSVEQMNSTTLQQSATITTYNPGEEDFWGYVLSSKWLQPVCRTALWSSMSDWERKYGFSTAMDVAANLTDLSHISTAFQPSKYSQLYRLTERIVDKGSRVFTITATSPCCGYCHVHGRNVTVYLWPTSNSSSLSKRDNLALQGVSKLVDSNGFTFTSPSVYVAFDSIYATNWCGELRGKQTAGTMAFHEHALSTHKGYQWDTEKYLTFEPFDGFEGVPKVFTIADWGTQRRCTQITESFWQYRHIPRTFANLAELSAWSSAHRAVLSSANKGQGMTDPHYFTVSYNPCSPSMYLPTGVLDITKGWADCSPGLGGFFDPPSTLKPGHGFTSMGTFNNAPASLTTVAAAPGPSPAPTIASLTVVPDPKPATPSVTSSDLPPATNAIPATKETAQLPAPEITSVPVSSPSLQASRLVSENPLQIIRAPAKLTVNGMTITADSSSAFVIGSQTLEPGHQITISGTLYSLAPTGDIVVIGTSTQTLFDPQSPTYGIGSQTLTPGMAVTVSGTKLSLQPEGSSIVIGGSTIALRKSSGELSMISGTGSTSSRIPPSPEEAKSDTSLLHGSRTGDLSSSLGITGGGLGEAIATIGGLEDISRPGTGVGPTQAGRNETYTQVMFRGGSTPVRLGNDVEVTFLVVAVAVFCATVI